jgi:hypothetical protein
MTTFQTSTKRGPVGATKTSPGGPASVAFLLQAFGRFHDLGTGRGSLNFGALRYAAEDFRGPLAVPQIVVIEPEFQRDESGGIRRTRESVVRRYRGLGAISALAASP